MATNPIELNVYIYMSVFMLIYVLCYAVKYIFKTKCCFLFQC